MGSNREKSNIAIAILEKLPFLKGNKNNIFVNCNSRRTWQLYQEACSKESSIHTELVSNSRSEEFGAYENIKGGYISSNYLIDYFIKNVIYSIFQKTLK